MSDIYDLGVTEMDDISAFDDEHTIQLETDPSTTTPGTGTTPLGGGFEGRVFLTQVPTSHPSEDAVKSWDADVEAGETANFTFDPSETVDPANSDANLYLVSDGESTSIAGAQVDAPDSMVSPPSSPHITVLDFMPAHLSNERQRLEFGSTALDLVVPSDDFWGGPVEGEIYADPHRRNSSPSAGAIKLGSIDVNPTADGGYGDTDYVVYRPEELAGRDTWYIHLQRAGKYQYVGNLDVGSGPSDPDPMPINDDLTESMANPSNEVEVDPADQPGLVHADNEQGFALAPSMEDDYPDADALIEDAQDGTLDVLDGGSDSDSSGSDNSDSSSSDTTSSADDSAESSSGPGGVEIQMLAVLGLIAFILIYQYQS